MANNDGLERMKELLSALGNPEKDLKFFHIAGTNGKGSTSVMIASILEKAGYSVGLYTSPHIHEYYERMQIWSGKSGQSEHRMISSEKYDELEARVDATGIEGLHLFEKLTAMAYMYFAEEGPDFVVLECGIGGRLDSTNTIEKPLAAVVCQVGLEHTDLLGRTIFKVAREKAGIAKPGVPLVSQMSELLVKNIMTSTAREVGCEFVDASLDEGKYKGYKLGLKGSYQCANAATAVKAIEAAGIEVSEEAIREGLESAFIPGRFEIFDVAGKPWVLDGAHNPDAIDALVDAYSAWARTNKIRETLVVIGCMQDKNYNRMLQSLASKLKGASYVTVNIDSERSEDSEKLGSILVELGKSVRCCENAGEAFEQALAANAQAVLVVGSIYLVGEMREIIKNN